MTMTTATTLLTLMFVNALLLIAISIDIVSASTPIDVRADQSLTHIVNARGAHSIPRFVIADKTVDEDVVSTHSDDDQPVIVRTFL
jgi:hypothetical protein